MSARMEYKGIDVEEAIKKACDALGVAREHLEITIVSTGSSGIFGLGRKKAVIAVSLKNGDGGPAARPVETGGVPSASAKPAKAPKPAAKPAAKATVKAAAKTVTRANIPAEVGADGEEPDEAMGDPVSAAEMEVIRQDVLRILELMGCSSPVTVEQGPNNKVLAHISGDLLEVLVGPEGQTLDALEYLMRKIITRKFPQKVLFALDAGQFRVNRLQELQERALGLAMEVKETGKTRTIPAINPAERRIVHMALQNDTEIRSRSVGDGVFKKVLIYLPGKGRRRSSGKRKGGEAAGKNDE